MRPLQMRQSGIWEGAWRDLVIAIAISIIAAVLILTIKTWQHIETLTGPATVIDGDTIVVRGQRVRLYGIDAPELTQQCMQRNGHAWSCGSEAKETLRRLVGSRLVDCRVQDTDVYGRKIAICLVGGEDIGQAMVSHGMAVAYRRYSRRYVPDETRALTERKGMWEGMFTLPEVWRRDHLQ